MASWMSLNCPLPLTGRQPAAAVAAAGADHITSYFLLQPYKGTGGLHFCLKSYRLVTTTKLLDMVVRWGLVLVEGPRRSGKTSLMQLLEQLAKQWGFRRVITACNLYGGPPTLTELVGAATNNQYSWQDLWEYPSLGDSVDNEGGF